MHTMLRNAAEEGPGDQAGARRGPLDLTRCWRAGHGEPEGAGPRARGAGPRRARAGGSRSSLVPGRRGERRKAALEAHWPEREGREASRSRVCPQARCASPCGFATCRGLRRPEAGIRYPPLVRRRPPWPPPLPGSPAPAPAFRLSGVPPQAPDALAPCCAPPPSRGASPVGGPLAPSPGPRP